MIVAAPSAGHVGVRRPRGRHQVRPFHDRDTPFHRHLATLGGVELDVRKRLLLRSLAGEQEAAVSPPVVAILGTRYQNFMIEEQILDPLGVTLVAGDGAGPGEIVATAAQADVILAGSRPRFTADVIGRLRVKGIVRYGVGTDTIDLDAARQAGIAVARVSDYGTEAVAFHAVSLAVAQLRRIVEADRVVRSGEWGVASLRPLHLPSTLTAGIIGYGRIGRQAATYFRGLGLGVCAFDAYVTIPDGDDVERVSLEQLLERSDVVSLHAPGSPDGRPLLGAPHLRTMKPGSVLVNTARGSLVDVPALVEGLAANRPGRAALDVYPQEPPDLAQFEGVAEQVVFTPHMAWYTEQSEVDLREKAAHEAVRLLRGEPLRDPVVEPSGR
jgi:D-3-phosphoglycerate dehydrogenase